MPQPLLYLSAFFEEHRDSYYDLLLAVSQEGKWAEWIGFFLQGVTTQSKDAILRIRQVQQLHRQYREKFQEARSAGLLLNLVDLLFESPYLTVRMAEEALKVSFRSAHQNIDKLVDAGILTEVTGRSRYRIYQASEILDAVERPLPKDQSATGLDMRRS